MPQQTKELVTMGEQAYRQVRMMILTGELPGGQWLRKRSLASLLQMSPTPVVEALRRLEHEGLVRTEPLWGTRVRSFTVPEFFELASMRVMLERMVARCCAERLTDEQIACLRPLARIVDELDISFMDPVLARIHGAGTVFNEDVAFHLRLAREAGLSLVSKEIERLQVLQATCRIIVTPAPSNAGSHMDIVDAIATRDGDRAEEVMRRHIQVNIDAYMPVLRERFGEGLVILDPKSSPTEQDGDDE